jgi:hypothetical protein
MWHMDILLVPFGISFADVKNTLFYLLSIDNIDLSNLSHDHCNTVQGSIDLHWLLCYQVFVPQS